MMGQEGVGIELEIVMEPNQEFAPGWILTSPRFSGNLSYPVIVGSSGEVAYNELAPYRAWNFELQPSGQLTWYNQLSAETTGWEVLDSGLVNIETLQIQEGQLDFHDLEIREDGTVLLMGFENVEVMVTDSVPDPADPNRVVKDCILEEHDAAGNLTWLWRASEHIPVSWCSSCNWTFPLLDAYHHNSFQTQENGDILLNLRNMDMVVMIDHETQEVLWRLGGPESDFTFASPSDVFTQQHDAQMLSDHQILLFDNGTTGANGLARGAEYTLDFEAGTVTLVASWPHPDSNIASSQGSIQRLEDGGTLIGWGTGYSDESNGGLVSEFGPDGELRGTLYFPPNHFAYRAKKVRPGHLPLHTGCADFAACNYDPMAVVSVSCIGLGDPCDDGDACTVGDEIQEDCSCLGVAIETDPDAGQCLDPNAVNFNPCASPGLDDGSCQYQVTFRLDPTAWSSVPQAVTLVLGGSAPLPMAPGGFGTWHVDVQIGSGLWDFGFEADGMSDGVLRSFDLSSPEIWDGAEVRSCFGALLTACPGCSDPDNHAYSPFSGGDAGCTDTGASGCTYPSAVNFNPLAFFEDGTCVFDDGTCAQDINADGLVSVADILDLLTFFGTFCD